MKISTVRHFRDHATGLMRSNHAILVTRRGRLAGIFVPLNEATLPVEFKREIFCLLTAQVSRHMQARRTSGEAAAPVDGPQRKTQKLEAA